MNALAEMKAMAKAENRAARRLWHSGGKMTNRADQVVWHDWGLDEGVARIVLSALRAGLGVEDMQATGDCTADEARKVISILRRRGDLWGVCQ